MPAPDCPVGLARGRGRRRERAVRGVGDAGQGGGAGLLALAVAGLSASGSWAELAPRLSGEEGDARARTVGAGPCATRPG